MAINFKPFEELFAPEYQSTYISADGHIDVGPNTYSVFHYYTMQERQVIFQVCEKYLPWEYTEIQEQWERTMYMYQFVIKSPPPFPYEEYPLSEDIIMAITWEFEIEPINIPDRIVSVMATRTDDSPTDPDPIYIVTLQNADISTAEKKAEALDTLWNKYLNKVVKQTQLDVINAEIEALETQAKANFEGREP